MTWDFYILLYIIKKLICGYEYLESRNKNNQGENLDGLQEANRTNGQLYKEGGEE